ncbi:DUF2892 domain-containing protein [Billgrantia lactosivorans]|uniref:DUF2892 domain-containing protein n=1 Tax=Billgrantia lactosivorans TaxID=2185141 RepID=UPI000DAC7C41|nr:DUF2892 domain-containing protein [Halomonas lactosivorans]
MLPSTTSRVENNTSKQANYEIQKKTMQSIVYYSENPNEIDQRLSELDHEWDIERTLEANAATISLVGISLGVLVNKRWLALPFAVSGFLLQHAIQGWCPPVVIFRNRGIRTSAEIDHERYALKALRGDFENLDKVGEGSHKERAKKALDIVKK